MRMKAGLINCRMVAVVCSHKDRRNTEQKIPRWRISQKKVVVLLSPDISE